MARSLEPVCCCSCGVSCVNEIMCSSLHSPALIQRRALLPPLLYELFIYMTNFLKGWWGKHNLPLNWPEGFKQTSGKIISTHLNQYFTIIIFDSLTHETPIHICILYIIYTLNKVNNTFSKTKCSPKMKVM